MQLDYFIVWGHGLPVFEEVVELVAAHPALDVLYIRKHHVTDMAGLLDEIYSYEWPLVPWEHTKAKTEFLLEGPHSAGLILVMNKDPQMRIQENKDPRFRMPESATIKDVKTLIRERFDPNQGGAGTIKLNPSYNPNQHIVHASDFDSQVPGILKAFGTGVSEDYFLSYWEKKYTPPPAAPISTLRELPIDSVSIRLLDEEGGLVELPIGETPHYQFLMNGSPEYRNYWKRHCGTLLIEDHSPITFKKLAEDFNYLCAPYEHSYIKVDREYKSLDGDHRLAILKAQGVDTVIVEVCDGA